MSLRKKPTSEDIWRALTLASSGPSDWAKKLRSIIGGKFEDVMDMIDSSPEVLDAISGLILKKQSHWSDHIQEETLRLLQILMKTLAPPEWLTSTTDYNEQFWNEELMKIGLQIRWVYTNGTPWYSSEKLQLMSDLAVSFLDAFLFFYSQNYQREPKESTSTWVIVATKKKEKKHKKESWEEDDEDFISSGDAAILMAIFTLLKSYIDYLSRNVKNLLDKKDTKNFFTTQSKNWRWKKFEKIITKLKTIIFEKDILDATSSFGYSFEDNLTTLLQDWDSFGIQMEEIKK